MCDPNDQKRHQQLVIVINTFRLQHSAFFVIEFRVQILNTKYVEQTLLVTALLTLQIVKDFTNVKIL